MRALCAVLTLGVRDVARARAFYADGLGWPVEVEVPGTAVYLRCGPALLLCLHDAAALEAEALAGEALAGEALAGEAGAGGPAVVLGHNTSSAAEVEEVLATVRRLGAEVVSPGQDRPWGGFSGFFADLDGHRWEVAYNPVVRVAADGSVHLVPGL